MRHAVVLARRSGAVLHAVRAWLFSPPWRDVTAGRWRAEFAADARRQIPATFAAALVGIPDDLPLKAVVLEGFAGQSLVGYADSDADVLVVGADRRIRWPVPRYGPVTRHCVAYARCPVLVTPSPRMVQTSPVPRLMRQLARDIDQLGLTHLA